MSPLSTVECQRRLWHGLVPAVPVPFRASGEMDPPAQERYVAYMAAQPVAGVAVWAHTGRGLLMNREQRLQVLRGWTRGLGPDKVVIAGVGGSPKQPANFSQFVTSTLEMAEDALGNGAHALLVHPPLPFRQAADSEELILDYHKQLASLGAPLILFYLYEAAGGIAYSIALLRRLLAFDEVAGMKVATLDSVMTFQAIANLLASEFPRKLLITGEDRFLGYTLMCGAQAALIGMGAACTALQCRMMKAYFGGQAAEFLELSRAVDRLSQVTFIPPMEGYIRRILWALVHLGVIDRDSAHDPWGPELPENEFSDLGDTLRAISELPSEVAQKD